MRTNRTITFKIRLLGDETRKKRRDKKTSAK